MKFHIILSLVIMQVAWLEAVPLRSKSIKVVDSKHHKGGVPYSDLETVGLTYKALKRLGLSPTAIIGKDLISSAALAKIGIYDHDGVLGITTRSLKKLGYKFAELRRAGLHSNEVHKGKKGVTGVTLPGLHRVKGHVRSGHKRPTKVRIGYLNKIGFTPRLLQLLNLNEKDIDAHGAIGLSTLQKHGVVFRGHNGYITLKALKELGLALPSLRKLGINKKHIMNNSINIRILSRILGKNGKACNKNNSTLVQNNNSTATEDQFVFNTTQYHIGDIFGCQGTGIAAAAKGIVNIMVLKVRSLFDIFPFLRPGPADHKAL